MDWCCKTNFNYLFVLTMIAFGVTKGPMLSPCFLTSLSPVGRRSDVVKQKKRKSFCDQNVARPHSETEFKEKHILASSTTTNTFGI